MGATKEQLHEKRTKELKDYVLNNGNRVTKFRTYWDTFPICIKDICVCGVLVVDVEDTVYFGEYDEKTGQFNTRRTSDNVDHKCLSEILYDMKSYDKKKQKV